MSEDFTFHDTKRAFASLAIGFTYFANAQPSKANSISTPRKIKTTVKRKKKNKYIHFFFPPKKFYIQTRLCRYGKRKPFFPVGEKHKTHFFAAEKKRVNEGKSFFLFVFLYPFYIPSKILFILGNWIWGKTNFVVFFDLKEWKKKLLFLVFNGKLFMGFQSVGDESLLAK